MLWLADARPGQSPIPCRTVLLTVSAGVPTVLVDRWLQHREIPFPWIAVMCAATPFQLRLPSRSLPGRLRDHKVCEGGKQRRHRTKESDGRASAPPDAMETAMRPPRRPCFTRQRFRSQKTRSIFSMTGDGRRIFLSQSEWVESAASQCCRQTHPKRQRDLYTLLVTSSFPALFLDAFSLKRRIRIRSRRFFTSVSQSFQRCDSASKLILV